jgi:hypothetical protein
VAAAVAVGEPGGRLLVPLILRTIDPSGTDTERGALDATSAYGYPGPLFESGTAGDHERAGLLVRAALNELQRSGVIAVFLRFHPLLGQPSERFRELGCLVHHGETVSIDLDQSDEQIRKGFRADHRYGISRAVRQGFSVRIDGSWERFEDFLEIYEETMRRVEADHSYFFSREQFLDFRLALGEGVHLCLVEFGGRVAAAALLTEHHGVVQYHLSGTRDEFLRSAASKLVHPFICRWARERGHRSYHLGGGVGCRSDTLFAYKAGFSPLRHAFYTWRAVCDHDAYASRVRDWEARHGRRADDPRGFFPAYRKGDH